MVRKTVLLKILKSDEYHKYWKIAFWLTFLILLYLTLSPQIASPIQVDNIDKVYHVIAFAGFTFIYAAAFSTTILFKVAFNSTCLGITIELLQITIPGRGFSFGDMAADFVGVIVGIFVISRFRLNTVSK